MFNCYAHGWSSQEKPCPICCPLEGTTATEIHVGDVRLPNVCTGVHVFDNYYLMSNPPKRRCVVCGYVEVI